MTIFFLLSLQSSEQYSASKIPSFKVLQSNLRIDTSYGIFHYSYIKLEPEEEQKSNAAQGLLSNFSVYQLSQP